MGDADLAAIVGDRQRDDPGRRELDRRPALGGRDLPGRDPLPGRGRRRGRGGRLGRPDLHAPARVRRPVGARSTSWPGARRQGIGGALLAAISDRARAAGKTDAPRSRPPRPDPRCRSTSWRTAASASTSGPRSSASTWPAWPARGRPARRGRPDDAGRAARPRRGRPRGRARGVRRHPRRRRADPRPATSPSSGSATSTGRTSRTSAFMIAVERRPAASIGYASLHPAARAPPGSPGTT